MTDPVETIRVAHGEAGVRLDKWFKTHFPDITHGYLQKLLRSGQVRVNSRRVQASERLEVGAEVRVPKVARQPAKTNPAAKPQPSLSKADRDTI